MPGSGVVVVGAAYKDVRGARVVGLAPMARRPVGFTLVELLVCVALLAVLLAALLPALASARASALKVVCTARLRDLTTACNMHRMERGAYPVQPGATLDPRFAIGPDGPVTQSFAPLASSPPPKPTDMDPSFLNVLGNYLAFPKVDAGRVTPSELPQVVQCPTVEDAGDADRMSPADVTMARPALYTGYAYCVRPKDGSLVIGVRLLRPERLASPTMGRDGPRSVVWADDVQWSMPDLAWHFAHSVPRAAQGPRLLTYSQARGLLGQHRAYADGSVEWVNGSEIDLDLNDRAALDEKPSLSAFGMFYFWF